MEGKALTKRLRASLPYAGYRRLMSLPGGETIMANYSVTLGKRSGETRVIAVDWEKLPDAAKEKIIAYGVQRIFNDMVGGSDSTLEDKVKDVEAAVARFYAGDIGRKAAEGVSAEVSIGRSLVRQALKAKYGAKSPEWATFTGLSDDEQTKKLDALFEKNKAKFAPQVAAEIKRRAEKAATKVDIDL